MKATPIALLVTSLLTAPALADTLYDNGPPNGDNAYSNATEDAFGSRRTLLDDFVVPEGSSWRMTGFRWEHIWLGGEIWHGWNLEILFRSDAGGAPGDPITGLAEITGYVESLSGRSWFSRPGYESWATFEPITLGPGRYWFEATIVGLSRGNNFWLITGDEVFNNTPCWVNYDDLGGLQPGIDVFEVNADLNFVLEGEVISSCPEDLDGSGAVDIGDLLAILSAWGNKGGPEDLDGSGFVDVGDILAVLAAWGPC